MSFLLFLVAAAVNQGCSKIGKIVESAQPYRTKTYEVAFRAWTREARIHRGLEVELIVGATFRSKAFRRAYAEEYAEAYRLAAGEKEQYIDDHVKAAELGHDFLFASYVPQRNWDDFDETQSMWRFYLVNNRGDRLSPIEVRRIKREDTVTPHFYPYITPWRSAYAVRFPYTVPATGEAFVGPETEQIKLIVTGVLGTAELSWRLN